MAMTTKASAVWKGSVKEGEGSLSLPKAGYEGAYSFGSRFENGSGTNPEELIAAAHAGCFSMALSLMLGEAGFTPERIETSADVTIEPSNLTITTSHLVTRAKVPGIDDDTFQQKVKDAAAGCPVSKALAGVKITVDATLEA